MRIVVVSRSWPSSERSGVTLAAGMHVQTLLDDGHEVYIIGASENVVSEDLPVDGRFYVKSSGSGALYSPAVTDIVKLRSVINNIAPDLIVVESWQTALTDVTINIGYKLGLPILMVSHGISVHPFSSSVVDIFRSLGWLWYRVFILPKMIKKLTTITALDMTSQSERFFDRKLAQSMGIPVVSLVNAPINWKEGSAELSNRILQILVVGYFSPVKNQMEAIDILNEVPSNIFMRFIGKKSGLYYKKCVSRVEKFGLQDRVIFSDDSECEIADEISKSFMVLSTSITEALPITLLESMASGTPFVATSVGAVPSLACGYVVNTRSEIKEAIIKLATDEEEWRLASMKGKKEYSCRYTSSHVAKNLKSAIRLAVGHERKAEQ